MADTTAYAATMKAVSPGKLILSGEHAVIYDCPALAMAIDLNAQSILRPDMDRRVSIHLLDLEESASYTLRALRAFRQRMARNYRDFLDGRMSIREVMHKPIDLFQFAFIIMLDGLHLKVNDGLNFQLQSSIPIGCGLGSSAATILSTLRAIGHYFRVEFRPDWYYAYSVEAERLQHGHPSGVDSYIALHGGAAIFRQGEAERVPLPRLPLYLVNTGTPETTTGECVEAVRQKFANSAIWSEFGDVTLRMRDAVERSDAEMMHQMIRTNHQLLTRIGVVPGRVQQFIAEVEQDEERSAKICGAGAVHGDGGGVVLVCGEEAPVELCNKYGFSVRRVRGDPLGTRMV